MIAYDDTTSILFIGQIQIISFPAADLAAFPCDTIGVSITRGV